MTSLYLSLFRVESAVRILGCDIRTHQKQSDSEKSTGTPFEDSATSEEGFSQSPYPSVDQFITSQLSKGGVQGAIRRWTFFPQGIIIYKMCFLVHTGVTSIVYRKVSCL